jgi:site-specific DNA-methyltransferase (adenine-specific)
VRTTAHQKQPDIIEVIADLSNEEVFTPPRVANAVLDLLPEAIWSNPTITFLDPGSKTGIFLREVTKRLMKGLVEHFPDETERLEHILNVQVWGLATTELTSLISRRTLYCSKDASSAHSAVPMAHPQGHVWYEAIDHKWTNGKCSECGANTSIQREGRDNYAYGFIHEQGRSIIKEEFPVKFDVIIGNPPYQMDMGETSDVPLYDKFVQQAIELDPTYISMIIPSRWMQGGKGLDDFRRSMLGDRRLSKMVDFSQMASVFPGAVDFEGGVCYFLWDANHNGKCDYEFHQGEDVLGPTNRDLSQYDVLVRDFRALAILEKVLKSNEPSMTEIVSGQTPFGLLTNFKGYRSGDPKPGDLKIFLTEKGQRTERWVDPALVNKNDELARGWKVLVPGAYGERGSLPAKVLGPTMIAGPDSVCTQTYLAIGPVASEDEAKSLEKYLETRFARFLISLRKISQHAWRATYTWLPQQSWDKGWTDEMLFKKYGITAEEQAYISTMVKGIAE